MKIDRINQLEAFSTDDYFKSVLAQSLHSAFRYFPPLFLSRYSSEMQFLLDFLYFRLTVARDLQKPGFIEENIQYVGVRGGPLSNK